MSEEIIEDEIDLLNLISVLINNIKWIIGITGLSMVTVVVISIISLKLPSEKNFMPNEFTAKSLVMLNSSGGSGGLDSLLQGSGMGALASIAGLPGGIGPSDSDLAVKLATTNSFINRLNVEFDLENIYETKNQSYPKTALRSKINEKLKINFDSTSGLLEISYTDINKELATKIVNKATEILEKEFADIDVIRNKNHLTLIKDNKAKIESEIENITRKTIAFQKKHNLIDVDIVFDKLMEQMAGLQTELLNKEIAIENYSMVSNIQDPGYKRLINERLAILNAIEKLENGEAGNFPPVKDLPELAIELSELKSELRIQQAVYTGIIQQYEALKLTSEGTGPTFQVLEYSEVPELKSGPSRGKLCMVVTFAGFFFSIFFVFVKEAIIHIKNDPEKMKRLRGER